MPRLETWRRDGSAESNRGFRQHKPGPATFALLLYPVAKGEPIPEASIELVPARDGADPVAVRVILPDGSQRVFVDQLGEGEAFGGD